MKRQRYFQKFVSLPIGSTIAVQWEDGGLWTHGMIERKGDHNHHDRSYHICITMRGRLVTQTDNIKNQHRYWLNNTTMNNYRNMPRQIH